MMSRVVEVLTQLLVIPSPTFQEQQKQLFIRSWMAQHCPDFTVQEVGDNLIFSLFSDERLPHLSLIGHSDVVPEWFEPRLEDDRLHGSGASDMQGALAAFMVFLADSGELLKRCFNISFIVYVREEGTPLKENGLYEVIQERRSFMESIDLAIIGEPTDLTVQLGCVGSLHAEVEISGISAHSARPWNGENALYKALPFIRSIQDIQRVPHSVMGVTFYDVMEITQSSSEPGRTSVPGYWKGNVNFRYAPVRSSRDAQEECLACLQDALGDYGSIRIVDNVGAGKVVESALLDQVVDALGVSVEAKQAWTDVAQLGDLNVSAFNFGPGLTAQAHQKDEYIDTNDLSKYLSLLNKLLISCG